MSRLLVEIEPQRRRPATDTPKTIEEMLREMDIADAKVYQDVASSNYGGGTRRLATEQYAYSRWLMGIDDYYLTLPDRRGTTPRPHRRVSSGHRDHTPLAAPGAAAMDPARPVRLTPWTPGAWRRPLDQD